MQEGRADACRPSTLPSSMVTMVALSFVEHFRKRVLERAATIADLRAADVLGAMQVAERDVVVGIEGRHVDVSPSRRR